MAGEEKGRRWSARALGRGLCLQLREEGQGSGEDVELALQLELERSPVLTGGPPPNNSDGTPVVADFFFSLRKMLRMPCQMPCS